jgi:uroporphyrinogen decarboxylase
MSKSIQLANSHRDRMQSCLGMKQMKQPPVALWRHFPVDDQNPGNFARAIANFQDTFDFDLIKVTPSSSFCIKDWGILDEWKGNVEGTRDITSFVIEKPEDWEKLSKLDPNQGVLNDQWDCLKLLSDKYLPSTPILQTIFNPLAQAKNLAGRERLLDHLRNYPDQLKIGLETITQSTLSFIEKCMELKIDGIFYAIQHAQKSLLTQDEFEEFCKPYDTQILEAVSNLWLNMIHIHGENIYFKQVSEYPAIILNWHDRHTYPSLCEARKSFQGVLCGGISRIESLVLGDPKQIAVEAKNALDSTERTGFILGTGCVVPITAPYGNLLAVRSSIN